MKLTIKNIGILAGIDESGRERIAGADMKRLDTITNAYVTAEEGLIVSYGPMEELPEGRADEEIDARGGVVLPAFCDSHTHIVYAGSREGEFVDKSTASPTRKSPAAAEASSTRQTGCTRPPNRSSTTRRCRACAR